MSGGATHLFKLVVGHVKVHVHNSVTPTQIVADMFANVKGSLVVF
jgi:hypothetical protein